MIITRTPFRVSFLGGGTDYPDWYKQHGGSVLSTSINKYCYITVRHLYPFFAHKIRVVYSKTEHCKSLDEVKHPSVRETLKFLNFNQNVEIHHDGDLPARSGMGSSSSFTVGLLNTMYAMMGRQVTKQQLAEQSIYIEQELIKEKVGSQDQCAAAFGGLNHIIFNKDGSINVSPVIIPKARLDDFDNHVMLFYTGIMRTASEVAKSYHFDKHQILNKMNALVQDGIDFLQSRQKIAGFGELLHQSWELKQQLSQYITNPVVAEIYERAMRNGATGGKITGAGGGGFLMFIVPPEKQNKLREALSEFFHVPFTFERNGSQIIHYDPQEEEYQLINNDNIGDNFKIAKELEIAI